MAASPISRRAVVQANRVQAARAAGSVLACMYFFGDVRGGLFIIRGRGVGGAGFGKKNKKKKRKRQG